MVVELQIDIRVFVPSCLRQTVFIEFLQVVELAQDKLTYLLVDFLLRLRHGQLTKCHHMITDTGDEFNGAVGKHVDLFNLILPQLIVHQCPAQWRDVVHSELAGDVARSNDQVAGVLRIWHHAIVVVEVIVFAALGLDAHQRQTLRDGDVHMSVLRFEAFGRFHKRTGLERFLYLSCIDIAHGLAQRIELRGLKTFLDFLRIDEAIGSLIGNVDTHLGTHLSRFIRLVEGGEGKYQVGGKHYVEYNCKGLFPVDIYLHSVSCGNSCQTTCGETAGRE